MAQTKKLNSYWIKWIISAVLAIIILCLPTGDVFTGSIKAFAVITVFFICMVAFGLFKSNLIPAILLIFAYTFLSDLGTATSGWGKDAPWIVLSGFILVQVMSRTNLLKRIAYRIVLLTGGSYTGICIGFYLVGLVMSVLGNGVAVAIITIGYGVVQALNLSGTKGGAGLMIASCNGLNEAGLFVMNPGVATLLYGMAASAVPELNASMNYGTWFIYSAPYVLFYIGFLFITIKMFKPKEGFNSKEYFRMELQKLGKMSADEKKTAIILAAMIIFLFTNSWHKVSLVYGFIGAVILLFIPGINVGTGEDIKNTNFAFPFFVVACLGIGSVATALGVGDALVGALTPMLSGVSPLVFLLMIYVIVFLMNFVMTPMAIFSALTVPLTLLAVSTGYFNNIFPLLGTMMAGAVNLIMPHASNTTLILYSFDALTMKDFVKNFGLKAILNFVWVIVMYGYWCLIGLM